MSPLWREQVQVLVSPSTLTLVRLARGVHPVVAAKASLPVLDRPGQDEPPWTGALQTLGRGLATDQWAHGDLSMVLSNHFVRYQVVPWRDELHDESEFRSYAAQSLRQAYGRQSADWAVEISIDRVGEPVVACAIDRPLLEALTGMGARRDGRLVSVRPLLMEAFNWAKDWLTDASQWLVLVEEGLICAALIARRRWVAVRTLRTGCDWPGQLVAMLEREPLFEEEAVSAHTVLLHVVHGSPQELPAKQWTVHHLCKTDRRRATASVLACVL